ncbi:hypothetical protein [Winogradskyella sp. SYSU M77433]|uniref:hypothetical protein n=1 Tax=Winogradskyella sp. SYSU M77433 TaxID=3042722 RepID=UPI00248061D5|nr:hypothetical protein [Winogradskyella sp. SYSU M77433]MDH7912209.1 hypothetical protein [Winogradskyella sp. SYSU M77433]
MRITVIIVLCFAVCLSAKAQANDTEAALYNIGFGAIFSTVGAIINKPKEEPLGKVIKKSLWQGALGGYLTFESKRILREAQRQEQWEYFWAAKLVNAAGTSIKENAALNTNFYDRWHLNIGFNRIEIMTKDEFSIKYRLMPVAFTYTIGIALQTKFELNKTLKTGEFIFSSNTNRFTETHSRGIALPGNVVLYSPEKNDLSLMSHEIIHLYQSNDFSIFNTYLNKSLSKWSSKNSTINWFNNHLYIEYHYLLLRPVYVFETETANSYYDNFLEREAGYYSNTLWAD